MQVNLLKQASLKCCAANLRVLAGQIDLRSPVHEKIFGEADNPYRISRVEYGLKFAIEKCREILLTEQKARDNAALIADPELYRALLVELNLVKNHFLGFEDAAGAWAGQFGEESAIKSIQKVFQSFEDSTAAKLRRLAAEVDAIADTVTPTPAIRATNVIDLLTDATRDHSVVSCAEVNLLEAPLPQFIAEDNESHTDAERRKTSAQEELLRGAGSKGMKWQEAASRLELLRLQGEAFQSQPAYAKLFPCSSSTINTAIRNTPSLHVWASRQVRTPKVGELLEMVTDNQQQHREAPPDVEIIEEADVDTVFARLLDEATPDKRAELNALPRDQRAKLALFVAKDPGWSDRVWDRK